MEKSSKISSVIGWSRACIKERKGSRYDETGTPFCIQQMIAGRNKTSVNGKTRPKVGCAVKGNKNVRADDERRNSGPVPKFVGRLRQDEPAKGAPPPPAWIIHALGPRPSARRYVRRCYLHQVNLTPHQTLISIQAPLERFRMWIAKLNHNLEIFFLITKLDLLKSVMILMRMWHSLHYIPTRCQVIKKNMYWSKKIMKSFKVMLSFNSKLNNNAIAPM